MFVPRKRPPNYPLLPSTCPTLSFLPVWLAGDVIIVQNQSNLAGIKNGIWNWCRIASLIIQECLLRAV